MSTTHACLGIAVLGQCAYTTTVYFDLGEAVSSLGFILTVQQLLRPIYRFRLRARGLTLAQIYILVFVGVAFVAIAALLPSFPAAPNHILAYPIVWEIAATLCFAAAYGAVVLAVVKPVRLRPRSIERYAGASAWLLSSATERDQLDYLEDFTRNFAVLIRAASYAEGLENTSAFFDFIHRRELARASWAWSFLRIAADPVWCATIVKQAPWLMASMLREVSEKRLHSRSAEQFIRELGKQAIMQDDSMMEREIGYHGFGSAPLLSDNLFSSYFILRAYDPLDSFRLMSAEDMTARILKRFNSASRKALTTMIEERDVWQSQVAYSIEDYYESVFMRAQSVRKSNDSKLIFQMHQAVEMAVEMAELLQSKATPHDVDMLYLGADPQEYRHEVLEQLAEIAYNALAFISNFFESGDDPFWTTCIGTFQKVFPAFGQCPDGMTPFQQRLATKLIRKLGDNMNGFYPSICRVFLACMGPFDSTAESPNRTAHRILKEAMYFELQKLRILAVEKPDKLADYLPRNVTYDVAKDSLTHTYLGGSTRTTVLSDLHLGPISLATADVRQPAPTQPI